MKISLFLLLLFLTISSCNTKKREINRLVKAWSNKEILFPDQLEAHIFGRDTNCPEIWDAKYKILNFTDTSGCTECKMQLYGWQQLKQQTDSLQLDVSYIFIAWAEQYEELETLQWINKCDIPFFYDRTGQMMQLNQFPEKESFRTFLLDSDNRVMLIGNPVNSPDIRDLYLQVLKQ